MTTTTTDPAAQGDRGLRRRVWGWMAFDWASQPFYTLCLTFIFGPYFAATVTQSLMAEGLAEADADARAQALWSWTQTGIGLAIAATAPLLGAMADRSGRRMGWVAAFSGFYVIGTAGLWLMLPDASSTGVALLAFAVAMIGAEYATIFTNAMLPGLVPWTETGRVSGSGYALGYAGGVVALALFLALFADDGTGRTMLGAAPLWGLDGAAREGTRFVGPFTAIWYVLFMVPFFVLVREPRVAGEPVSLGGAWRDVVALVRAVPGRRSLMAWLGGSMLYRDALAALYAFGGTYAALVLDWEVTQIGIFGIVSAVTAAAVSWLGGRLDGRFGPKPVITGAVLVLTGVVVVLCFMSPTMILGIPLPPGSPVPDAVFYVIGATIGGAGGVLQAASRTMMVRHAEPARATEAFGLYALSGKATAFLAPLLIAVATTATGSARLGVFPVAFLFLAGLVLLRWVEPDGDRPR